MQTLLDSCLAKAPQDRPWDAQAVAVILKDLCDKAARKEPVPMVFAGSGQPTRLGATGSPVSSTTTRWPGRPC